MKQLFIVASLMATMIMGSCTTPESATTVNVMSTAATLAYVDVDQVLMASDIFEKEGLPLQQRTEAAQRDWQTKDQKLQSEAAQLQQRYQNGLITSTNAQKEQASLESRAKAFQEATQKQMAELDEESNVFANRAQELLRTAIRNVNKERNYSMIVTAASLIEADSTLDISQAILDEYNKVYAAESK